MRMKGAVDQTRFVTAQQRLSGVSAGPLKGELIYYRMDVILGTEIWVQVLQQNNVLLRII